MNESDEPKTPERVPEAAVAMAAEGTPDEITITSTTVVHSALWSALVTGLSAPLLAASTVVVARLLGVADFGRFAYYTYTVTLLTGLGDLGIGTALIRAGAHAAGSGDHARLISCVRGGTSWSLLQIPWGLAVGWLILPSTEAQIVFAAGIVVTLAFLGPSHYLVMTSNLRRASQIRFGSLFLSIGGLLAAASITRDPDTTFAAGVLGSGVLTSLQIVAVPRGRRLRTLLPGRLPLSRHDVGFGVGALMNSHLSGFVFSRSEVLFFRHRQASALGTFAAAQTVAARSSVIIDVFFGSIPAAMTSAAGRGADALQRAFRRTSGAAVFLLAATGPMTAVAVVGATPALFGRGYDDVAAPAVVLTIVSLLQSSLNPVFSLRFAQRSIVPMIIAGLVAAGIDAALAAALVPDHGVAGAVIANGGSSLVYIALVSASYLRDSAWRLPVVELAMKTLAVGVVTAAVAAPLVALSSTTALVVGVPCALIASLLMVRIPGIRLATEAQATLTDAMPVRVRRPAANLLRKVSGTGGAAS